AAGHTQYGCVEMAIDVEKRLPGHRGVGDDRMHRRPHGRHALIETLDTTLSEKFIPVRARRMHGREVAEIRFHAVRKGVVSCVHTAPERISATGGDGLWWEGTVQKR